LEAGDTHSLEAVCDSATTSLVYNWHQHYETYEVKSDGIWLIAEDSNLVGLNALTLGKCFPTFRTTFMSSPSRVISPDVTEFTHEGEKYFPRCREHIAELHVFLTVQHELTIY